MLARLSGEAADVDDAHVAAVAPVDAGGWWEGIPAVRQFLLEGFTDEGAQAHVASPHFQEGLDAMRPLLASTPQIISEQVGAEGFGPMGELQID